MHRFRYLGLMLTLLVACQSGTDYRPAIDRLNIDWNQTTQRLNELASTVSQEAANWQVLYDSMDASEAAIGNLPPEVQTTLSTLKIDCAGHGVAYRRLLEELSGFFVTWEAVEGKLDGLNEALATGQLPQETDQLIRELEAEISQAQLNIEGWQKSFTETKSSCQATVEQFSALSQE